jgi:deoxyribonuclease IV
LHARSAGKENSKPEWLAILGLISSTLGKDSLQSMHIHLSGIEYSAKGEKNHLPLKESDFNLIELMEALVEMKCSGRILCESPIMEEDALYIQETLQKVQN